MTLLPAVLSLLGDRVNALSFRRRRSRGTAQAGRMWDPLVRNVMRRPVLSALFAGGILVAATIPLFSMKTGSSGIETLPRTTDSWQAFRVLSEEFSGGQAQPIKVVADGRITEEVRQAFDRLQTAVASDARFGLGALEVNPAGDLAVLAIPVKADPSTPVAYDAVRDLRSTFIPGAFAGLPVRVLVGGMTAFEVDMSSLTKTYTPIVFGFVLGMSFILLLVVFRSLVVPTKAILMNVLSVGAAYGLVTWVNQQGHAAGILGFQRVRVIEIWMPLFLFTVLFGLSMDYHVFLLSRIREHYDKTADNVGAVAFGVRSTARIITGAALIMVAVFGGFASGELVMFQQMGFGLAVAVLLDATIVRMILVPSTMRLLGPWNWYLPKWLGWIPAASIEGTEEQPVPVSKPDRVLVGTRSRT
jgi:uncharacterized membrane protein YdfJ with MMPL/SSD domain